MKKLERANFYFNVTEEAYKESGAFNPVIGIDSEFFIDPLLLKSTKIPEFKNALDNIREYFKKVIVLLKTNNDKAEKIALQRLTIPEIKGVSLGYGVSDDGSAIGPGLAAQILLTTKELLAMGVDNPEIFEIMGIFEANFGPDRLSDAIIFINKDNFYNYSNRIAKDLGIKNFIEIKGYQSIFLPKHPLEEKPFIFIPQELLKDLPIAHSYDEISAVAAYNASLRESFNKLLRPCFFGNKNPKKSEFREYIFKDKERMAMLIKLYNAASPKLYDFDEDPAGLYLWLEKAQSMVTNNPLEINPPKDSNDLEETIKKILESFRNFIEKKGGWRILYNNKGEILNERHARLIFYCISIIYLQNKNIDISPESNAGSGPVDFKLSTGKNKIIVEVKLTSGKVIQGYTKQTGIYEKSEDAIGSYFLVMKVTESAPSLKTILKIEKQDDKNNIKHPKIFVIDGTKKKTASKA